MFDHYIGLGVDCEVVVQLRRLTGCAQAHIFDWHVSHHEPLMRVLRTDFADYLQLPNLVLSPDRRHILDTATGLKLHHLFRANIDGTLLPQRVARDYPRVRDRADYLLRRWRATVSSSASALYVRHDPNDELTVEDLLELREVLRAQYPGHRSALLWVRSTEVPGGREGTVDELADGVYVARLPVRQPRAVQWQGDDAAWDQLFSRLLEVGCP